MSRYVYISEEYYESEGIHLFVVCIKKKYVFRAVSYKIVTWNNDNDYVDI
jgi:hypothetical protein